MSFALTLLTFVHVVLSLVGIVTGFVLIYGFVNARRLETWTSLFFLTNVATSVTGFFFPVDRLLPSHAFGILALLALGVAILARNRHHLVGKWLLAYAIGVLVALYLNVFVLVVQLFRKIPALHALAPTESEAPFFVAQGAVLIVYGILAVYAVIRFRAQPTAST